MKVLDLPEGLSNRKRLKLDGFAGKIDGEPIRSIPCYLIGQLAKNTAAENAVSGAKLLGYAMRIIASAAENVGGRIVLIECRDDQHLRDFYRANGFEELDKIPDKSVPMVQMIKAIY